MVMTKGGQKMTLGERIKEVRTSKGLTQEQFSGKIGLSRNYVARIEIGERLPSDRTIKDICREFGVDELWLRTGIGEAFSVPTREEEMTKLFKSLMADRPETFRRRAITALLRFSSDSPEWELLENIYNSIKEEAPDP